MGKGVKKMKVDGRCSIYKFIGVFAVMALIIGFAIPILAGGGTGTKTDPLATDAVFTVGSATADGGDTGVTVPVTVNDCPPFSALGLQFSYDEDALTLVDITPGKDLPYGGFEVGLTDGGSGTPNGIVNIDYNNNINLPEENAEILILEFDVSDSARTGNYEVSIDLSFAGWVNYAIEYLAAKDFIPGMISVTQDPGLAVCSYDGDYYLTVKEAIDAVMADEGTGTITMIKDATIEDYADRIVVPADADITLDMNGCTITSEIPGGTYKNPTWVLEIAEEAVLNIVNNALIEGGFVHDTGGEGTQFTVNNGDLNMSDVKAMGFSVAMINYGTIDTMNNCNIDGTLNSDGYAVIVNEGSIESIADCSITGEINAKSSVIDNCGFIGIICDSTIVGTGTGKNYYGQVIDNCSTGTIGKITSTYSPKFTTIETSSLHHAIVNRGVITLIEGEQTFINSWTDSSNWGNCIFLADNGTIGTISGGTFESDDTAIYLYDDARIDHISGGMFRCDCEAIKLADKKNGQIGTISGGIFIGGTYGVGSGLYNSGTIQNISGGEFSAPIYGIWNYQGNIGNITGGEFGGNTTGYGLRNDAVLESISGGDFTGYCSGLYNLKGNIESITGGKFIGAERYALWNSGGTIGSISDSPNTFGPMFKGGADENSNYSAISNEISGEIEPAIAFLEGGYYKTDHDDMISGLDYCTIAMGYDFSTVLMPEEVMGEAGYYHFGKLVDVTWVIEDQEDETDQFVIGDPVYYPYKTPTKAPDDTGYYEHVGWSDGEETYAPGELPDATVNVTYTAVFDYAKLAEDYLVSLETAENVNVGDELEVDVKITSEHNDEFYGATVGLTYDPNKVGLDIEEEGAVQVNSGSYKIRSSTSGNLNTIEIMCAAENGHSMEEHAYELATLNFTVVSGIDSGTATFEIMDSPIVDQEKAVQSQHVTKGEDVTVNLWNLTVTFRAGDYVTLEEVTAYVRHDEEGLYTSSAYTDPFDEPEPSADDHYTLDDPLWKPGSGENVSFADIEDTCFTANATYTATASPSKYDVTLQTFPVIADVVSGVIDGQATYLTPIIFTAGAADGYVVSEVSYTVGDGEAIVLEPDQEDKYTIPGTDIKGDITIYAEQLVDGEIKFINNNEYNALLSGTKLLLLTVESKLGTGAYKYEDESMFYSSKYSEEGSQVYVYIVDADVTRVEALANIQINTEAEPCTELDYEGDVNLDGELNSTDVVLTYGLYLGHWAEDDFSDYSDAYIDRDKMRIRLEADVNGDGKVDTSDAQKIFDLWAEQ